MTQVMNTGRNRLKPNKAQFHTQMVILNLNLKKKSMTFFADHHTVALLLLLHLWKKDGLTPKALIVMEKETVVTLTVLKILRILHQHLVES
jgi:hypothetical protein